MTTKWILAHHDDYRSGPHLSIGFLNENGESESESDSNSFEIDDQKYTIEIENTDKFVVYHTLLHLEEAELIPIEEFDTKGEAESFAKEQYYLYTGNFPFIVDGMTCAYKSTGERKEIQINENAVCKLINPEDIDDEEYLIISNGTYITAYSLNPSAEW